MTDRAHAVRSPFGYALAVAIALANGACLVGPKQDDPFAPAPCSGCSNTVGPSRGDASTNGETSLPTGDGTTTGGRDASVSADAPGGISFDATVPEPPPSDGGDDGAPACDSADPSDADAAAPADDGAVTDAAIGDAASGDGGPRGVENIRCSGG